MPCLPPAPCTTRLSAPRHFLDHTTTRTTPFHATPTPYLPLTRSLSPVSLHSCPTHYMQPGQYPPGMGMQQPGMMMQQPGMMQQQPGMMMGGKMKGGKMKGGKMKVDPRKGLDSSLCLCVSMSLCLFVSLPLCPSASPSLSLARSLARSIAQPLDYYPLRSLTRSPYHSPTMPTHTHHCRG